MARLSEKIIEVEGRLVRIIDGVLPSPNNLVEIIAARHPDCIGSVYSIDGVDGADGHSVNIALDACAGIDGKHEYASERCTVCGITCCSTCAAYASRGDNSQDGDHPILECPVCGHNVLSD